MKNIVAIDLFCGAGGLSYGLSQSGIKVSLGVDLDPVCEFPYVKNNNANFLLKSVKDISGQELGNYYARAGFTLLAGCAPCQTFSSYNKSASPKDERWWLLLEFSRLISEVSPDFVAMENVPGLMKQGVFKQFVNSMQSLGYNVDYRVVSCDKYGVPQKRKRLIALASRIGKISILSPEQFGAEDKTVRDAIGNFPNIKHGETCLTDPLHKCAKLSDLNIKRIKNSLPGGTWKDWPEDLVLNCHKKICSYKDVYGRLCWDKPSGTITTRFTGYGNGRFGHPVQDRALSLREGAALQSFPIDYKFVKPGEYVSMTNVARMIGNAVPPVLGKLIGDSVIKACEGL